MDHERARWAAAIFVCAAAVVALAAADGPGLDPADATGAAIDACFDCKDMKCDWCPRPEPCKEVGGYCRETVRNLSQFCAPRINGQWESCKWRIDDAGTCVARFLNPCTPEHLACTTPLDGCGPLGVCIPEGVCIP
jgi:hypothetical protein